MKYHRAAEILFFISLLYVHCLPNNCDIKEDASIPIGSTQANKGLPADSSKSENVPTQQNKAKKVNLDLEKLRKENVQPSIERVNSNLKTKDTKQFDNRIGQIDPIHVSVEKLKLNDATLKSSRSHDQPASKSVNNVKKEDEAKLISKDVADKTAQTEPLSPELLSRSQVKEATVEKLPEAAKSIDIETATTESITEKLKDVHYASAVDSEKIVDDTVHQQYDGMPSFDEWKKMMLAEQQRGGRKVPSPTPPGKKISSQKRRRNYSSCECGAKILAANNEAEGTSRILNELVDEYMLNPCKAKIWFVIELCETVQASSYP